MSSKDVSSYNVNSENGMGIYATILGILLFCLSVIFLNLIESELTIISPSTP